MFFGGDPEALAVAQVEAHKRYLAAELGIETHRVAIRFWKRLLPAD